MRAASMARSGIPPLSTMIASALSSGSCTTNQRPRLLPANTTKAIAATQTNVSHGQSRRVFPGTGVAPRADFTASRLIVLYHIKPRGFPEAGADLDGLWLSSAFAG